MKSATGLAARRRVALLVGCLGFASLALLTLVLSADATPTYGRRLFGLWRMRDVVLAGALFVVAGGFLAAAASRHALLAFVAAGMGVGGTFAMLEAAGALGLVSWPALLAPRASELGTRPVPHLDVAGTTFQDTASRWGLPSDPMPFRYRTDRHGFRNDIDRAHSDVYLLGDSVLVSVLVPFPQTVAPRLEGTIGRPVMQVALIGKSAQEVQQLFRDAGVEVRGRLVIQFVFEGNDLRDSKRFREGATGAAPASFAERTLTQQLVLALQRLTQPVAGAAALRTCTVGDQTYTFLWEREAFAGVEGEATVVSDSLLRFGAEIRAAGGEFGVVFVPTKLRILGPLCRFPAGSALADLASHLGPLRDHLRAWSERSGVKLLDLTEPLLGAARMGRIPWFWGDTHWNAEGHAVAAEALAAWEPLRKLRVR